MPATHNVHFRASWQRLGAPKKIMKLIKKASIPDFAFHLGFKAKVGPLTTFADHADLRFSWLPVHFTKILNIVKRGADHFADHFGPSKRYACW